MSAAIYELKEQGHISHQEADMALAAHALGTPEHTIGYELEVLPSATTQTAKLNEYLTAGLDHLECREACTEEMLAIDFGVDTDGMYELQSPPAQHPNELIVATRGVVQMGWLPRHARGTVTAHVSIGTSTQIEEETKTHADLIRILRAVEMIGATTVRRLLSPSIQATNYKSIVTEFSWEQKGIAGVRIDSKLSELNQWKGSARRAEFRTPRYHDAEGFGEALEGLYYLSRGLLSDKASTQYGIYKEFEDWFKNFQEHHHLPDIGALDRNAMFDIHVDNEAHIAYFKLFANHLSKSNGMEERSKIAETVLRLREEFGLTSVPSQFSSSTPRG